MKLGPIFDQINQERANATTPMKPLPRVVIDRVRADITATLEYFKRDQQMAAQYRVAAADPVTRDENIKRYVRIIASGWKPEDNSPLLAELLTNNPQWKTRVNEALTYPPPQKAAVAPTDLADDDVPAAPSQPAITDDTLWEAVTKGLRSREASVKKTAEFVHSLGEKDGVVLLRGLMDTIDQQRAGRTPAAGEKIQIDFVMKPREALAADYHGRDPLITRRKTFGTFLALGVGATTYGFISQANHKSQANALTLQALGMSPKTEAPVVVKTEETIADFGPNAVVAKSTPQGRELVPADVERQKILEAGRAKRAAADDRWNVGAGGAGTVVVLGTSVALKKLWRYLKSPDQENADKSTSGLQKLLNTAGYRSDDVELRALTTAVSTGTPSR